MVGNASSGTLTEAVTLDLSVTGSMIKGLKDCDRSFRKTLHEPTEVSSMPLRPVLDLG